MEKGTIIRTIVLAVALINQMLVMAGFNTLPFTNEEIELFLTGAFTIVATLIAWWKNNDVTKSAQYNNEFLKKKGLK